MIPFEAFFGLDWHPFYPWIFLSTRYWRLQQQRITRPANHVARDTCIRCLYGDADGKNDRYPEVSQGLDINCYQVLYISDSALTPRNFYWETLHELGYQPRFYRGYAKRQLQKAWQY